MARTLTIATWNINSLRVRLPHVLDWLAHAKPDILALQELKMPTDDFPMAEIRAAGYEAIVSGQKTYNGVAILYRNAVCADEIFDFPDFDDLQRRVLAATIGDIRVLNLYVPNGESISSDKYQYKLRWLEALKSFLKAQLALYPQLIVLGDFNIAPEDLDVHDPKLWDGKVLFSGPERAALTGLFELGFEDCFRLFDQPEQSFSWWDYRLNAFRRNMGLRIDHILASKKLAIRCQKCLIDKEPRVWERPSDHAPVVAVFEL